MLDLDAYLARIGVRGRPTLAEVHKAHVTAIPFENLDPLRGVPVSLAPADLERKLVAERRGGYCFEQNLLLKAALEELGAQVEMLLARVRVGSAPGHTPALTHLVLRVQADGSQWHADVGFGRGTPLAPIPFGPGDVYEQSGWRYRVVPDGNELVLQTYGEGHWVDLYAFAPQPVPLVDVEMGNWFTSTHPSSGFLRGLRVGVQRPDGSRLSLAGWEDISLTEETPDGKTVSGVNRDALPGLLADRFGLPGFSIGADGGLRLQR